MSKTGGKRKGSGRKKGKIRQSTNMALSIEAAAFLKTLEPGLRSQFVDDIILGRPVNALCALSRQCAGPIAEPTREWMNFTLSIGATDFLKTLERGTRTQFVNTAILDYKKHL